jgi:hypothetical protein
LDLLRERRLAHELATGRTPASSNDYAVTTSQDKPKRAAYGAAASAKAQSDAKTVYSEMVDKIVQKIDAKKDKASIEKYIKDTIADSTHDAATFEKMATKSTQSKPYSEKVQKEYITMTYARKNTDLLAEWTADAENMEQDAFEDKLEEIEALKKTAMADYRTTMEVLADKKLFFETNLKQKAFRKDVFKLILAVSHDIARSEADARIARLTRQDSQDGAAQASDSESASAEDEEEDEDDDNDK